ncbi:MAG: MFS transporter, partial [Planctomycetales bacterium]|nr:MFS transporter [Planctomycetales bacterium]
GPTLGGVLLTFGEASAWRLIFAINAPIGILALYLLWRRVPAAGLRGSRKLDIPGAVLATAGLGMIAWGLTALGIEAGERLAPPAVMLVGGFATLGAFVWWESRAADPMIRLSLFANRAFFGANLYTLLLFLGFNAILFFLPMTIIAGWGRPEWQASLLFAPLSLFIGTLSARVGRLADRIGTRSLLTAGALVVAFCYAALALTMPLMDLWRVTLPILLLNGLGMALLVSPLSAAVMTAAPDEDSGAASGINNAVARSAGLIAVAAFGALAGTLFNAGVAGVTGLETAGFGAALDGAVEPVALQRFAEATNSAFAAIAYAAAALCLSAAIVAWMTQPRRPYA